MVELQYTMAFSKESAMKPVVIYSKDHCPYCSAAKSFLEGKGVPYTEVNLQTKPDELAALKARTGHRTVPQIFVGEQFIGGFTDMQKLDQEGKLDAMLQRG
jgi:glutaredoxin 3